MGIVMSGRRPRVHDLENIEETVLAFTTVKFLNSSNKPLLLLQPAKGAPKS
jgi:hypothetical protein